MKQKSLILIPDSKYTKMRVESYSVQFCYVTAFDTHLLQKQNHCCKTHYTSDIPLHTVVKYLSSVKDLGKYTPVHWYNMLFVGVFIVTLI